MPNIPLPVEAIIVIVGTAAASFGVLYLFRNRVKIEAQEGHNEIAGVIFATVGVLYAVVLAFVVFAVWERFSETDSGVSNEAAVIVASYRDTADLPQPLQAEQQKSFRTYVASVESELSSHGELKAHTKPDAMNPLWANLRAAAEMPTADHAALDRAADNLHEVEIARHERHLSRESSLPVIFWVTLVLGAAFTLAFVLIFDMGSLRVQGTLTALLAATIAAMLFLAFSMQQPFTGEVHVSARPFQHALLQFDAIDGAMPGN